MDELRLEGVHDDGEHLVLQDTAGTRHLLRVDQQLRQAVQRARRTPARRPRQGSDFGPRDIQARFRSGVTLEDIVEESGWEPERVRRYEWPILAERGHMAREAQKVELGTRTEGYRSAFEGGPLSLAQTIETRAPELGIAATSFDWDAWQRPDLLWTVTVRFRVTDPGRAPQALVDQQPMAQWIFNPATVSVSPEPGWAQHLTGEQQRRTRPVDGVFGEIEHVTADSDWSDDAARGTGAPSGQPSAEPTSVSPAPAAPPSESSDSPVSSVSPAAPQTSRAPTSQSPAAQAPAARSTEELLDVLDARRGQRLGSDEASDDQLAEILGRGMSHLDNRPRPITAPHDSSVFEHPVQPSHAAAAPGDDAEQVRPAPTEDRADGPAQDAGRAAAPVSPEGSPAGTTDGTRGSAEPEDAEQERAPVDADRAPRPGAAAQPSDPTHHHEATIHHLGRADDREQPSTPVVEITDDETTDAPLTEPTPISSAPRYQPGDDGPRPAPSPAPGQDRSGGTEDAADPAVPRQDGSGDADAPGSDASETEASDSTASGDGSEDDQPRRPRPRQRTGSAKRTRSSVPSWDDIVFGSKTD